MRTRNPICHFGSVLLISLWVSTVSAQSQNITVNPYETTNWQEDLRHHGNFHTHTTESDGKQAPVDVVDAYHAIGHTVLAITDHNKHTWPWTSFGRDPQQLHMIAIPGNELSHHHHTLSLFNDLVTDTKDHETALTQVLDKGGISVLAHPGRYWKIDEQGNVPADIRDHYVKLFEKYPNLIGMEVVNQTGRFPHDRALWDALLTELMPKRPVWGMANDDSHNQHHIGLNTTVMLVRQSTPEMIRKALETGNYYFQTVTTHPKDKQNRDRTPVIRSITVDKLNQSITLKADMAGDDIPDENFQWITAGGKTIHHGPVIAINTIKGIDKYIRAEIKGDGGTTYTQPFGVTLAQ